MNPAIEIDGLREAMEALKRMAGTPADAKALNKMVVDEIIVPGAKIEVPVRSGRLRGSIDSDATATYGYVLAGARGDIEYAGVIHFGWATRGLGSGLGGSVKQRRDTLTSALDRNSNRTFGERAVKKAARYGGPRKGKGMVRGGPIDPQPFIYDAIDQRQGDVFRFYDKQMDQRAELLGLL